MLTALIGPIASLAGTWLEGHVEKGKAKTEAEGHKTKGKLKLKAKARSSS